jgi:hypothetical protein
MTVLVVLEFKKRLSAELARERDVAIQALIKGGRDNHDRYASTVLTLDRADRLLDTVAKSFSTSIDTDGDDL